jgi:hypothetical protein
VDPSGKPYTTLHPSRNSANPTRKNPSAQTKEDPHCLVVQGPLALTTCVPSDSLAVRAGQPMRTAAT